ncbi:MAG: polyhydroxyalkanoate synthesis repressor PhaR [Hyphomicrobiales bacterium]|nr:polyhydroxyalkanoate synthesis repressor PhaR [Hyphomicrobiales bacterium]
MTNRKKHSGEHGEVIIKKYPNRRLYDTHASRYVTLDDLCILVKKGVDFKVVDARSEEDITRTILTQIIFELEQKGYNLMPTAFLRQIIAFYDEQSRSVLYNYLENMMSHIKAQQTAMPGTDPMAMFRQFEEMGKQNMDIFEQTMNMFAQFNPMMPTGQDSSKKSKK